MFDKTDNKNENTEQETKENEQKAEVKQKTDSKGNDFIPRTRFNEVNNKYKEASQKLQEFEKKQQEAEKKKLEEEGKYQELLSLREKELNDMKSLLDNERKNNKLERVKNRSLNLLNKEGIIDGEDGLKFLNFEEIIDLDNYDEVLSNLVSSLKESKSYLFKNNDTSHQRNKEENGVPGAGTSGSTKTKTRDKFSESFARIYGS
jgi:hypothetical protein